MSQDPHSFNLETTEPRPEYDTVLECARQTPTDVDSWLKLVVIAEESKDFRKVSGAYKALLEAFPNTSSVQIAYIGWVLDSTTPTKYRYAEGLFTTFLKNSPFVDLWKYYLAYVRQMNAGPNTRDTVCKAFEFALNHIGQENDSTEIWREYIVFLKAGETSAAWYEDQKNGTIRKAYHRAIQIPIDNVERLWEEYIDFENGLNKIAAKKFITDLTPGHMRARTVLNALREHITVLFPPAPDSRSRTSISLPRPPTFNAGDKALVRRWRIYLKWEEGNPLEIEDKDKAQLRLRIQGVYRKALVCMRFFPDIWYMAYTYTMFLSNDLGLLEVKRKDRKDESLSILKAGIEANPSSFLLNFAYAEVLESNKTLAEAHDIFVKFLAVLRGDLDVLKSRSSDENPPNNKELSNRRTEYGVVWIAYMRFARRSENVKAARTVFGKARKDCWTPWEVYEAAALMEYHCTKATDVATRIFEKGLESFYEEPEFALRYLGFLISINDDFNARALFERVVTVFPPDRARPLWDHWARYEYRFGSLEAVQSLERRISEVYLPEPPIKRFAERHKYFGIDTIAVCDLGVLFGRGGHSSGKKINESTKSNTLKSIESTQPSSRSQPSPVSAKRQSSPNHRRRDNSRSRNDHGPPAKRQRPDSPARKYNRERWDGASRKRHESPSQRDQQTDRHPRNDGSRRSEVVLPPILPSFIGQLPPPSAFEGPVFRTEDLMNVFRGAVIPSSIGIRARSPTGAVRPPPDYSPYQGPNTGRRSRS